MVKMIMKAWILWFFACSGICLYAQDTTGTAEDATRRRLEEMLRNAVQEAEETEVQRKPGADSNILEIDGLVINETRTKTGRGFYDLFFTQWVAPEGAAGYTLYIHERAHPLMGVWVWIKINETVVFQSILRPQFRVIENAVQNALPQVRNFLIQDLQNQQQLAGEDMTGTGIY